MPSHPNKPVILSESPERRVEGPAFAFRSAPAPQRSRQPNWLRLVEASALAVAICFSLGAANPTSRLDNLSHRVMCQCGCAQLLGECDHVGCPDRDKELSELTTQIATGLTDQQILDAFVAKYGMTVLAAPPAKGFNLVAWIAPFAVFAAALLLTILLIRRWGGLGGKLSGKRQAAAAEPVYVDPAERERIDRIRRETGSEGGF